MSVFFGIGLIQKSCNGQKTSVQTIAPEENCPWTIASWTIAPWIIAPRTIAPEDNCPLDDCPRPITSKIIAP